MKQEIADKWIAALESGEYEQGEGALNKDGKFCCLGVLCDLAVKDGLDLNIMTEGTKVFYDGNSGSLPDSVANWAGMKSSWGAFAADDGLDLADHNDRGEDFADIAVIIRENVEKL